MSNVIGFKAFKNTLKRDSGYAPVSGENGYSVIRCVFPVGGDRRVFCASEEHCRCDGGYYG